jgi:hypothetical protein
MGDTVPSHVRPSLNVRCSHDSPEASSGREKQSRLAQSQLWAGEAVMTHPRLTLCGSAKMLHGPPYDLPGKACPRATTRLDKLDPGRQRPDDRVMH